jgi:hypothetical protein
MIIDCHGHYTTGRRAHRWRRPARRVRRPAAPPYRRSRRRDPQSVEGSSCG